jgi:hypothetical protein
VTEANRKLELVGEPPHWDIRLVSGAILSVNAHAYCEDGAEYLFTLLLEGAPVTELEVLRIPMDTVARIRGG